MSIEAALRQSEPFITCNSGDGNYSVNLKCRTLKDAQSLHGAIVNALASLQGEQSAVAWAAVHDGDVLERSLTTDPHKLEFERAGSWVGCDLIALVPASSLSTAIRERDEARAELADARKAYEDWTAEIKVNIDWFRTRAEAAEALVADLRKVLLTPGSSMDAIDRARSILADTAPQAQETK